MGGADFEGGPGASEGIRADDDVSLQINLLSGFALKYLGNPVHLPNRKARALVGYLALTPGNRASREQLVGLLWSEASEDRARASLRQTVRGLRKAFDKCGYEGMTARRNELLLTATHADINQLHEDLDNGRVSDVLLERERLMDSLLAGLDDLDPAFRNWLLVQRESSTQKIIRKLNVMLGAPDETGDKSDDETGKLAAAALCQIEPTNESACRYLIRHAAAKGDTASALVIYNRLWTLLDQEYDTEPSRQTMDLIASVKLGDFEPEKTSVIGENSSFGAVAAPSSSVAQLTLQVAEFDRTNINEQHQHICLGFQSEMIAMLIRFREWTIVDKRPTTSEEPSQGVNYELGGHFLQEDDEVYFVCQLRDHGTGAMVWSDSFKFGLNRYFSAQQEIVRKITFSLNVHISQERLRRFSGEPDVSLDIYDRWLRGQAYFLRWSPESRVRATKIFNSIIDDAPNFARAFSSLVSLHNSDHFVFPGVYRSEEVSKRSLEFARKAVDLDPLDSRSQLHLGWAQAMNGDFDIAQLAFGLACELNEHDPWTVASAAGGFAFSGLPELGLEWSEKALELAIAPVPMVWAYTSVVRYINKDYEGSLLAASQSESDVMIMNAWRIATLWKLGRHDEAREHSERFFATMKEAWYGAGPPTREAIIDWAATCFPIRSKEVLQDFRRNLEAPTDRPQGRGAKHI